MYSNAHAYVAAAGGIGTLIFRTSMMKKRPAHYGTGRRAAQAIARTTNRPPVADCSSSGVSAKPAIEQTTIRPFPSVLT